jgi:hypothetical protein
MKIIPNWQDKLLKCHFCGTNKSVKYAVELHGAICDNKHLEVCVCNKCALLFVHPTEKGGVKG